MIKQLVTISFTGISRLRLLSYILIVVGILIYAVYAMQLINIPQLALAGWVIAVIGIGIYGFDFFKMVRKKFRQEND
jgi:hypothetical protein